jgi:tRNA modification GTPase
VAISAKQRKGLEDLHKEIDRVIWEKGPPSREELLITNVRHKEALCNAIDSCQAVVEGLRTNVSPEFITMDMRAVLKSLGSIIGKDITEDILSAIFAKFCIGK